MLTTTGTPLQNLLHPDEVATETLNATADIEERHDRFDLTDAAKAAAMMAATIALAACGGGSSDGGAGSASSASSGYKYPTPTSDEEAVRFLTQAQFSATDEEVASLRSTGYASFIVQQSAMAMTSGVDWLDSKTYNTTDNATQYYNNTYPADYMLWNQLLTAPDSMRKRIQLALTEFFVVSMTGIDSVWTSYLIASYWDMLGRNAFGNFRTLLNDVTLHPAMGWYLNTKGNQKENSAGRQPDENYGREVMQLMTIGLYQLNLDGTEKTDSSGVKLDSYTASDVTNIARVFTGYDYDYTTDTDVLPVGGTGTIKTNNFTKLPMKMTPANHSVLASTFLGVTIPAQSPATTASAAAKLKTALDTLFNHPNVGPFFGKQMIQRMVTSNPSKAYVARVASVFNNNGSGVRGDLRAVFSAILLDDEARGPSGLTDAYWGKLREPVVRLAQWGRTFGIQSARGSWKIGDLSRPNDQLGQSTLRSGSVFNFFRPGYVPPSTALATVDATAPEFQIVTETSVGGYLNFMMSIIKDGIFVNGPDVPQNISNGFNGRDITCAYTRELAAVADASALVARINKFMCAGQLSAATQTTIVNALNATALGTSPTLAVKMNRVGAAVLLVMASPEYLVQK